MYFEPSFLLSVHRRVQEHFAEFNGLESVSGKLAQRRRIVQRLLHGRVRQVGTTAAENNSAASAPALSADVPCPIAGHHAETRGRPLAHDKQRYSHSRVKYVDQEVLIANKVDVAIICE
jgi:hypothetical protein